MDKLSVAEYKNLLNDQLHSFETVRDSIKSAIDDYTNTHFAFMDALQDCKSEINSHQSTINDGIREYDSKIMELEKQAKAKEKALVSATISQNATRLAEIQEEMKDIEVSRAAYQKSKELLQNAAVQTSQDTYDALISAYEETQEAYITRAECLEAFRNYVKKLDEIVNEIKNSLSDPSDFRRYDLEKLNEIKATHEE